MSKQRQHPTHDYASRWLPRWQTLKLWLQGATALFMAFLLGCGPAGARVGGGQSFHMGGGGGFHSGGGSFHMGGMGGGYHSGGSGHVGFGTILLIIIIVVIVLVYLSKQRGAGPGGGPGGGLPLNLQNLQSTLSNFVPPVAITPAQAFQKVRQDDANFSEIAFTDFAYALYARAHEARGRGDLASLASYLSPGAAANFPPGPPQVQSVTGVIVGGFTVLRVTDPDVSPEITAVVQFQTNYTEVDPAGKQQSYYAVEDWAFTRKRDLLSPEPEKLKALHCPNCGGALDLKPDGACAYCGVKITSGDFNWYVTSVQQEEREAEGPLLTQDVAEVGTDFPTVYQPGLAETEQQFAGLNPEFSWPRAETRFRDIFIALQDAWSSLKWENARPYETDNVFQMHRYWIEAYRKQGLHNVLAEINVESLTPVKFLSDAFYDSITCRIFADMLDYTENSQGKVVTGSKNKRRKFSEYWTFIRRRGAAENKHDTSQCPNCGAPLNVNMAGSCEFCGGKITTGDFDWVLSRIEQDETYAG